MHASIAPVQLYLIKITAPIATAFTFGQGSLSFSILWVQEIYLFNFLMVWDNMK